MATNLNTQAQNTAQNLNLSFTVPTSTSSGGGDDGGGYAYPMPYPGYGYGYGGPQPTVPTWGSGGGVLASGTGATINTQYNVDEMLTNVSTNTNVDGIQQVTPQQFPWGKRTPDSDAEPEPEPPKEPGADGKLTLPLMPMPPPSAPELVVEDEDAPIMKYAFFICIACCLAIAAYVAYTRWSGGTGGNRNSNRNSAGTTNRNSAGTATGASTVAGTNADTSPGDFDFSNLGFGNSDFNTNTTTAAPTGNGRST